MTPERIARLHSVLDRRQPDLIVITDFVHKQRNLSAIVRNCDAAGIMRVHAVLGDEDYHAFRGTAMGSHSWVEVARHPDLDSALSVLEGGDWQIVAADPGEGTVDFRDVDYTLPTALMLGAERRGVSEAALARATVRIRIPMVGMVGSLNVSVASGIVLAEAQRQRAEAGLYDGPRIGAHDYQRLFFEWGHPQVRDFCQERGLRYPELDDSGEIACPADWYASVRAGTAQRWRGVKIE
ncbi:MAG: tRNA (guanosine(18)-2'-O)-methyltransferase TrmH [Halioglobus sp.]|nr:tRNA (guanosine(18)-2'-O)-methyltransferase TrmH [Halioglobus sp.]